MLERLSGWMRGISKPGSAAAEPARIEPTFSPRNDGENVLRTGITIDRIMQEWNNWNVSGSGTAVTVESAQRVATVFACERVIGRSLARMPLILYKEGAAIGAAGRASVETDTQNPLYSVLKQHPNKVHTSFQLRRMMNRDLFYRGAAYAQKVPGFRNTVIGLRRLHPDRVTPRLDNDSGLMVFDYQKPDGTGTTTLKQAEILYLWLESDDGIRGLSPMSLHRETIGAALAMRDHGASVFRNGAFPGVVITSDKKIEGKPQMREDFNKWVSKENKHGTVILDQGAKVETLSMSMADAQYVELMNFSRVELCGIYGVPPHKIGDMENAHYDNVETGSIEFVVDCLDPYAVAWEQAIKRDLIGPDDDTRYVRHNMDALLRGDALTRAQALQIQRRNGIINANEWRNKEDLNPREDAGGEEYVFDTSLSDGSNPADPKKQQGNNTKGK